MRKLRNEIGRENNYQKMKKENSKELNYNFA